MCPQAQTVKSLAALFSPLLSSAWLDHPKQSLFPPPFAAQISSANRFFFFSCRRFLKTPVHAVLAPRVCHDVQLHSLNP